MAALKFRYNIRTFGIRRSGNHWVITSILAYFDDKSVHWLNNPPTPHLGLYINSIYHPRSTTIEDVPSKIIRAKLRDDNPFVHNYTPSNASLLETYEDKDLSSFVPTIPRRSAYKTSNVLILRDIFNMYASRLFCSWRSGRYDLTGVSEQLKDRWKAYAREYLGETNILDNKVVVNYNRLTRKEPVHTQAIKDGLDGHFTPSDRSMMMNYGFGSSFSKEDDNVISRYQKLPYQHLNTLQRWWCEDEELRHLHAQIFDFEPKFTPVVQFHVINLERRPDRWRVFQDRSGRKGLTEYTRFNAIDGSELQSNDPRIDIFKGNTFNDRRGIVGAALSHMQLWRKLVESEYEYYLILEDDVQFTDTFMKYLNYLLPEVISKGLPFVFLGFNYPGFDWSTVFGDVNDNLENGDIHSKLGKRRLDIHQIPDPHPKKIWGGTFCYLISRSRAQQMLSDVNANGMKVPVDTFVLTYPELYMTYPHIAHAPIVMGRHDDPDTDIQHDHIPVGEQYTFYQGQDYIGGDSKYSGGRTIRELIVIANADPICKGFNSYGFLKHTIDTTKLAPLRMNHKGDGLYVKKSKLNIF